MSVFTVTITGVSAPVEVYIGLPAAKDYVGAMVGDGADAWAALVDDAASGPTRSKVLVAATRYIDAQVWNGAADAQGGTTLQWPRTGVTNPDGSAVDSTTVPAALQKAIGELCALIAADPDVVNQLDSSANIREVGAGSARVAYFNPTSISTGTATKLPTIIQQLVGKWLAASGGIAVVGYSQGGNSTTDAGPCSDLSRKLRPW